MLTKFNELTATINSLDLSQLTDDQLRDLYEDCKNTKEYYDGLQTVVKRLANSVYGACGSPYFRFYNPEVAGDITTEGKMFMFLVDKAINNYFHTWATDLEFENILKEAYPQYADHIKLTNVTMPDICVYGDTDSRYVAMGVCMEAAGIKPKSPKEACDFVVLCEEHRLQKIIADALHDDIVNRNGKLGYMIMELETIGGKQILLAKKKYIMSLFWKDGKLIADKGKMKATGVEINQGSTTQFVKKSITAVLNRLLTPGTNIKDIYKIGAALVQRAKSAPIDEIIMSTGIGDYAKWIANDKDAIVFKETGVQAHVRAAAEYNHYIHVNNLKGRFPRYIGGKIHWYYALNKSGVFGVPDGVKVTELPDAPEIDYERQVDKLIINPLKRYLFSSDINKETFGKKEILFSFKKV